MHELVLPPQGAQVDDYDNGGHNDSKHSQKVMQIVQTGKQIPIGYNDMACQVMHDEGFLFSLNGPDALRRSSSRKQYRRGMRFVTNFVSNTNLEAMHTPSEYRFAGSFRRLQNDISQLLISAKNTP